MFQRAIVELWRSFDLPAPSFAEQSGISTVDNEFIIELEGVKIGLSLTVDQRAIQLRSSAGWLEVNPNDRTNQISQLLKIALGLLPDNRACLCLDSHKTATDRGGLDADSVEVNVIAIVQLDRRTSEGIFSRFADMFQLVETIKPVFLAERQKSSVLTAEDNNNLQLTGADDIMIFRP